MIWFTVIDNSTNNPKWNGPWVKWFDGQCHHSLIEAYFGDDRAYWINFAVLVCGKKRGIYFENGVI